MRLYAIYDTVAREFGPPFISINDETAVRSARREFMNIPSATDFVVHYLGDYDAVTGAIVVRTEGPLKMDQSLASMPFPNTSSVPGKRRK